MAEWYESFVVGYGLAGVAWVMIGFVVTYAATRTITRRIRRRALAGSAQPGSQRLKDVHIGGVHVHHQVWGILLVLLVGLLEFRFRPDSPGLEVLALLFGVGAALALDEFALWLHLDDVYWSAEGRKSIDAVMAALVLGAALLAGASPAGVAGMSGTVPLPALVGAVLLHVVYTVLCLLKGKVTIGLVGFFVPLIGLVGAVRLAKPQSYWARRFYGADSRKMARASRRFGPTHAARAERLRDLLSGGPVR